MTWASVEGCVCDVTGHTCLGGGGENDVRVTPLQWVIFRLCGPPPRSAVCSTYSGVCRTVLARIDPEIGTAQFLLCKGHLSP